MSKAGSARACWRGSTTDLLERLGIDGRMQTGRPAARRVQSRGRRTADPHRHRRTDRPAVMVYGQTELTQDLIDAAPARGLDIVWEAAAVGLHDIDSDAPYLTYEKDGSARRVDARFIAGCDGFHGPSREAIPESVARHYERGYPFGWLGISGRRAALQRRTDLCESRARLRPGVDALARHAAAITSRSRSTSHSKTGRTSGCGTSSRPGSGRRSRRNSRAARRWRNPSRLCALSCSSRCATASLFLAGDAAHIVPPTGAKGLNLAASDVAYLSEALIEWFRTGGTRGIDGYSERALARVWKSERFCWQLTKLMHRFPDDGPFERRMQLAELDYIALERGRAKDHRRKLRRPAVVTVPDNLRAVLQCGASADLGTKAPDHLCSALGRMRRRCQK